jgi:integrase
MSLRFSRLHRPSIRRLVPGQKVTEHGITAERLADGDTRYSVNIMVDGQRIHRVIGRESEGVTRTQAEEFIETSRSEARQGRLNLPAGRKTHLSFSEAADNYLAKLEEIGGKNIPRKRRQLTLHLKPFFKDQRLSAITKFTVDRYKKRRRDEEAENATINRELATLSHLLNRAVEWKWVPARPCEVRLLEEGAGRIFTLTDAEADTLLKAAVADSDPYCWLFIAFGLNTAMRHSEILAARFDQIDFNKLRLHVPDAKAGQREQPITPELAALLKREQEMANNQESWIFPTHRVKLAATGHRTRMDRPFRRAVKAAGLNPMTVTPHVMRHTAITNLVKSGADLPTIQKISGHRTLAMVLRYTHVHGQHIDRAIAAIGRTVPQQPENETANPTTPDLHNVKLRRV